MNDKTNEERRLRHERLKSRLIGIAEGGDAVYEEVWEQWQKLDQVEFTKWLSERLEVRSIKNVSEPKP